MEQDKTLPEEGADGGSPIQWHPGFYSAFERESAVPMQIVVTSRLDRATHSSLRILTRNAEEADVRQFLEEALRETEQGDKAIVDSILQVSVSANMALYEKIRRDDSMCQAMRELMKDEIARDVARGMQQGMQQGMQKKASETALRMLKMGRFSIEDVAFISGLPLEEVRKLAAN